MQIVLVVPRVEPNDAPLRVGEAEIACGLFELLECVVEIAVTAAVLEKAPFASSGVPA
jgi:hypothetical protein